MPVRHQINAMLSKLEKKYITYNRIEVSRSALLHNFDFLEKMAGQPAIPVLKANAYGHGIEQVATALIKRQPPYIAVDGYFEALRIRAISKQPVLIMGAIAPENYRRLQYKQFAFVVHDRTSINALGKTGKRIRVHLETNTGMNRHGAQSDELAALTTLILGYKNLILEGVMSHLADSDGDDPATVHSAVALFDKHVETIRSAGANPTIIHVAQTAGSLTARSKYATAFRLGIGLYGINPFPPQHRLHGRFKDLQPALQLISTVSKVIQLEAGDKVSYNYTFTAPKATKIGVLPLGYHEGVDRALSNQATVKIGSHYAPIAGRVCMNHTMINLADHSANVGDEVVVYSSNPDDKNSIDALAHTYNLFNYRMLTSLSSDVRRQLVA